MIDLRPSAISLGRFLLLIPLYCYLTAVVSFISGVPISGVLFILSVFFSGVTEYYISGWCIFRITLIWGIFITAFLLAVSTFFDDSSFDGIVYHQEIIVWLMKGWNPFNTYFTQSPDPDIGEVVAHFDKGLEIMAAVVAKFTHYVESGKLINLLIVFATTLVVYGVIRDKLKSLNRTEALLLSVMVGCNPVGMAQMFSYYNDFVGYYLILLLIAITLDSNYRFTSIRCLGIGSVIIIAAVVKFTAFFYCGVTIFWIMIWSLITKHRSFSLKVGIWSLIWALIAVTIFGYHPYITNYLTAGHPLYPLMGDNALDIMTGNTPEIYFQHNRFVNFWISLFTIYRPGVAVRFGGFGPLMGIMTIFSFVVIIYGLVKKYIPPLYLYIVVVTFLSGFIFDQSWWARYIPFIWLIPCVGVLTLFKIKRGIIVGNVLAICGILTGMLFLVNQLYLDLKLSITRDFVQKIAGECPIMIDQSLKFNPDGVLESRGVISVCEAMEERGSSITNFEGKDNTPYIVIDIGQGVNAYFNISYLPEVKKYFSESLTSKILHLNSAYTIIN